MVLLQGIVAQAQFYMAQRALTASAGSQDSRLVQGDTPEIVKSRLANPCSGALICQRLPCVQGVRFYDSVVEGDTPEAVDFRGIQNLSAAVQQHVGTMGGVTVFSTDGQVNSVQVQCKSVPGQATMCCTLQCSTLKNSQVLQQMAS